MRVAERGLRPWQERAGQRGGDETKAPLVTAAVSIEPSGGVQAKNEASSSFAARDPPREWRWVLITSKSIVVECTMPCWPEKIWLALTTADMLGRWLMRSDLQPATIFSFTRIPVPGWSGVTNCEVVEADRPGRLVYRWGDGTDLPATGRAGLQGHGRRLTAGHA
jgi:Activator of Hsp90 ATPase homolog 1-like protein